jgi:hypothetical protein
VGPCHHGTARRQVANGGTACKYAKELPIYWISSRRQSTRGGTPPWVLGGVLTISHRKNLTMLRHPHKSLANPTVTLIQPKTGSIWLRIGAGGGPLWKRRWTFGFHKIRGIYWLAENLLASQEGLCFMELIWLVIVGSKLSTHGDLNLPGSGLPRSELPESGLPRFDYCGPDYRGPDYRGPDYRDSDYCVRITRVRITVIRITGDRITGIRNTVVRITVVRITGVRVTGVRVTMIRITEVALCFIREVRCVVLTAVTNEKWCLLGCNRPVVWQEVLTFRNNVLPPP